MNEYQKCPVCEGRGEVPMGFYNLCFGYIPNGTCITPEICRTCQGKGIIVKPGQEVLYYPKDSSPDPGLPPEPEIVLSPDLAPGY